MSRSDKTRKLHIKTIYINIKLLSVRQPKIICPITYLSISTCSVINTVGTLYTALFPLNYLLDTCISDLF